MAQWNGSKFFRRRTRFWGIGSKAWSLTVVTTSPAAITEKYPMLAPRSKTVIPSLRVFFSRDTSSGS